MLQNVLISPITKANVMVIFSMLTLLKLFCIVIKTVSEITGLVHETGGHSYAIR